MVAATDRLNARISAYLAGEIDFGGMNFNVNQVMRKHAPVAVEAALVDLDDGRPDSALDTMFASLQKAIGQDAGDWAGMFCDPDTSDELLALLQTLHRECCTCKA